MHLLEMDDLTKRVIHLLDLHNELPRCYKTMKRSIPEIAEYMFKEELFENMITFQFIRSGKNADYSKRARRKGNELLASMKFKDAIQCYNQSIISAPFSFGKGTLMDNDLSFGYAARSTATFDCGLYLDSLKDVARAIKHGYPEILSSKLKETQAKCYMALGRLDEADLCLEEGLAHLNDLKGSTAQSKASLERLKTLSANSRKKGKAIFCKWPSRLDDFPPYDIPVVENPHPDVPALSSAVDICISKAKGRYLAANRDIYPGEVILREDIIGSTSSHPSMKTNCSNCLRRTTFPVPCPRCDVVVFCDETCRSAALKSFHRIECVILPSMARVNMEHREYLALRLTIQVGLESLRELVPMYIGERRNLKPIKYGYNENSIYSSIDYRTIYNLDGNKEKRTDDGVLLICCRAYLMLKFLEKTSFFSVTNPLKTDRKFIFEVLIRNSMIVQSNCWSALESGFDDKENELLSPIGDGIASVLSLIGHSCDSNSFHYHYPKIAVVRSNDYITKGSEITIHYTMNYRMFDLNVRQQYLSRVYQFQCRCPACVGNWRVSRERYVYLRIKCNKKGHKRRCPASCETINARGKLNELASECKVNPDLPPSSVVNFPMEPFKEMVVLLNKVSIPPSDALDYCRSVLRIYYSRHGYRHHLY